MQHSSHVISREVSVDLPVERVSLNGFLAIPQNSKTIVVFAHGSGSSRFSPRNQYVAKVLLKENIATLLLDLLTPEEEQMDELTREIRFDIPLLARRLVEVRKWLGQQADTKSLKTAYFGSSTGAAGALIAAALEGDQTSAVVSRGGRPDLAAQFLSKVKAPTLLLVGSNDYGVIELNESALSKLRCEKKMVLIQGATHLFEEPGTLEEVAKQAAEWFKYHSNYK